MTISVEQAGEPKGPRRRPIAEAVMLALFTLLAVGLVVVLVIALTGDDDGAADDDPTAQTIAEPVEQTEPSITPDSTYGTVEELKDAAVAAGYYCKRWRPTNKVALAAESGNCSGVDVFSTYASEGDLQAQLDTEKETSAMLVEYDIDPGISLVGPNWIIHGEEEVRPLQAVLGGTIVDLEK